MVFAVTERRFDILTLILVGVVMTVLGFVYQSVQNVVIGSIDICVGFLTLYLAGIYNQLKKLVDEKADMNKLLERMKDLLYDIYKGN